MPIAEISGWTQCHIQSLDEYIDDGKIEQIKAKCDAAKVMMGCYKEGENIEVLAWSDKESVFGGPDGKTDESSCGKDGEFWYQYRYGNIRWTYKWGSVTCDRMKCQRGYCDIDPRDKERGRVETVKHWDGTCKPHPGCGYRYNTL